jgi:outer membrane protein assembly factor BamC
VKPIYRLSLLAASLALVACSSLETDKVDYRSAGKAASLEVPPDLSQLSKDNRYQVPGGAVTASGFKISQAAPGAPTAASAIGDVRVERLGNQRWLVVDRPADQLWEPVKGFWLENGFLLSTDQSSLGIMETDWAENRAKIPQDFIRSALGKVFDALYSTSERDRFRTRLERNANGGTEIFISHRGMMEVYTTEKKDQTVWQPRPADPELEAEFLRRLMVKLGASPVQAKELVAASEVKPSSRVSSIDGQPVVVVDDGFERAWRRVGLALDRTGFTVVERDRSVGTYFVRYVEPKADNAEPGFLSKLLSGGAKDKAPINYRILVRAEGNTSTVSVATTDGAPDRSENAQRIVKLIADDLK